MREVLAWLAAGVVVIVVVTVLYFGRSLSGV